MWLTSVILLLFGTLYLFCNFSPTLFSKGCCLTSLGTSPALWQCPAILVPGIDVSPYATGSLWRSWPHFSASWMPGTPFLPGVGTHCCAVARAVHCRILFPPFHRVRVCLCPPFGGCGILAWLHAKEKVSCNHLPDGCAQVWVLFPVDM